MVVGEGKGGIVGGRREGGENHLEAQPCAQGTAPASSLEAGSKGGRAWESSAVRQIGGGL